MKKSLTTILLLISSTTLADSYDRKDYMTSWIDEDKDCLSTRDEVLVRDSLIEPTIESCKVTSGLWVCPYTGTIHRTPANLDIEHVVALEEAHDSGASQWSNDKRQKFANDMDNLIAVLNTSNRSKGSRDIGEWIPPNLAYLDTYIATWNAVKAKYSLSSDTKEAETIRCFSSKTSKYNYRFKLDQDTICE